MALDAKLEYKPDFAACMARVNAWYEQKRIDRPPVRFHHHNVEYERHRICKGIWPSAEARWMDTEFQIKTFVASLAVAPLQGETFPVFWPNLSAVVYNLFLGQVPKFDDVTAWIHPGVEDLDNLPPLAVQRENRYFLKIEELTRRALEIAQGRFMVGYTDMYAGIDCTAGLRGAERMCLDMVDRPAGLHRLIQAAFAEYPAVYRHFDRLLKAHGQPSVTWMNLPSFETFNVLACDFAVNLSTTDFDTFCLPVLRQEAECFTHNVFHLDGKGVARHIDSILTLPSLKAIQWVQGYGEDSPILQWIPLIRKIQAAGKSVIVDLLPEELDDFVKQVDPDGIMLWVDAAPSAQDDILRRVSRW
ncbi:MAG: hypothetical protein WCK89_14115 [bacterium]